MFTVFIRYRTWVHDGYITVGKVVVVNELTDLNYISTHIKSVKILKDET